MLVRRLQLHSQQLGDTIVEVLVSVAAVSAVIGGAYTVVNRSLNNAVQAQEHEVALKLSETQLERLKVFVSGDDAKKAFDLKDKDFCMTDTNSLEETLSRCRQGTDGRYTVTIKQAPDNTFTATALWDGPTGRQEKVDVVYKLYPAPVASTQSPPACTIFDNQNLVEAGYFNDREVNLLRAQSRNGDTPPGAGFKTDLPFRGINKYPDDRGTAEGDPNWATGDQRQYYSNTPYRGGYSIWTKDVDLSWLGIRLQQFDPSKLSDGNQFNIPRGKYNFWYSNPNQVLASGPNAAPNRFKGIIWQRSDIAVTKGTKYVFFVYIANLLQPGTLANPVYAPTIELSINGRILGGLERVVVPFRTSNDLAHNWIAVSKTIEADSDKVTITIWDKTEQILGDDFGMAAVSLRACT